MHILFLTDNFPPECNAPAIRTYEHAVRWIQAGHTVTVVTCFPNFPSGKLFEGYRNQWFARESMHGINVVRVKSYMTANERFVRRTLDYVSFMITGAVAACFVRKPDVIIATSPQFFCGVAGMLVSAVRRKPFVLEVRDIWPASIVALGVMKESLSIRILERLEKLLYRRATSIVVVTNVFKDEIARSVSDPDKISVVLNGVDKTMFKPQPKPTHLVEQYALKDKFVVGYIGTHGLAHDLFNVVKAIEALQHREDIVFIFVGAGAERKKIEALVADKQLKQVRMIPLQPRELMPDYLALCNLSLIPLRDAPLFATVIPSKLFESMAMGIPVLMAIPQGEATGIVESSQCGISINPGSPADMAEHIAELADDSARCEQYRKSGLVAAHMYTRDAAAEKMLDTIQETVRGFAK